MDLDAVLAMTEVKPLRPAPPTLWRVAVAWSRFKYEHALSRYRMAPTAQMRDRVARALREYDRTRGATEHRF